MPSVLTDHHMNTKELRRGTIIETSDGDYKVIRDRRGHRDLLVVPAGSYMPGREWYIYDSIEQRQISYDDIATGVVKFRGKGRLGRPVDIASLTWMF